MVDTEDELPSSTSFRLYFIIYFDFFNFGFRTDQVPIYVSPIPLDIEASLKVSEGNSVLLPLLCCVFCYTATVLLLVFCV